MSETVTLPAVRSNAESLLRRAGLKTTRPRVRVLERLSRSATPISHGELVAELERHGVDRTTVWRNLLDLTGAGLVRRTDLGDHVWRFELERAERQQHPHFTCTDCGTVECLPTVKVQVARGRRAPRAIVKQRVEVQLRGLCDDCA